jgi:hypothetical protein
MVLIDPPLNEMLIMHHLHNFLLLLLQHVDGSSKTLRFGLLLGMLARSKSILIMLLLTAD